MQNTIRVINLDRRPDRMAAFAACNAGLLSFERFAAIDGRAVSREDCIRDGIITGSNRYAPAALGCCLSHVTLWRECAEQTGLFTILEDDAILHQDFSRHIAALADQVAGLDIVLWAWNHDWPMMVDLGPSLRSSVITCNQDHLRQDLESYRVARLSPRLHKLHSAAGLPCYSVTPHGARTLLARCLPISGWNAYYTVNSKMDWDNTGVDVELCRHYPAINAVVCMPPLAVTPNDWSMSSLRGPEARADAVASAGG